MSTPLVAIAMPVYNGATDLRETLNSIAHQTFHDFTVVICDNVSTDATPDIAAEFAVRDSRFINLRQTQHLHALGNFLRAYRLTDRTVPYFIWAADDNIWAPTLLERAVAYMQNHPECSLCSYFHHHFRDDGTVSNNYIPVPWYFQRFRLLQYVFERQPGYDIYGLIRRRCLDAIRLDFSCRCYDELWYLLQLRALGTIHVIPEDLLAFLEGGLSTTKDDPYVARIINMIFSESELSALFALPHITRVEKILLAQKYTYMAIRHGKPETVRRWWLAPAYLPAILMNRLRPSRWREVAGQEVRS